MESAARNEPVASINESNEPTKTSEEGDTHEVDVGTQQKVIASKESSKDDATEKRDNQKLLSTDRKESLMGDIDVGEDAISELKPSRTHQVSPDASSDARLDFDLGSMTAQTWSQEHLQKPICKSTITLLQQGLSGTPPQDIILQFPVRSRPTL